MTLKIKLIHPNAKIPVRAKSTDSGLDLFSVEDVWLYPQEVTLVHTGISIELPPFTEAQIRPRSGLALKHKITVLNSPGTVDEGYIGEVCVILFNANERIEEEMECNEPFKISVGDRIAQMVIAPVLRPETELVTELSDSDRGTDGFGSTGIN